MLSFFRSKQLNFSEYKRIGTAIFLFVNILALAVYLFIRILFYQFPFSLSEEMVILLKTITTGCLFAAAIFIFFMLIEIAEDLLRRKGQLS